MRTGYQYSIVSAAGILDRFLQSRPGLPFPKVVAPVLRERRSCNGGFQESSVVLVFRKQPVHLRDVDSPRFSAQKLERVSGSHDPFLLHGKVKSAAAAAQKSRENVTALEFHGQLVTGNSRLADRDNGGAGLQPIADVKIAFAEPFRGEVLAEHAPRQTHPGQLLAPEIVVLGRVAIDGFVRASMNREIGLAVSVKVEHSQRNRAANRFLEDAGADRGAVVESQLWSSDVQRNQLHRFLHVCGILMYGSPK